jgi:hypothetical protein
VQLLTVSDAAERLRLPTVEVLWLMRIGELRYVLIDERRRRLCIWFRSRSPDIANVGGRGTSSTWRPA